MGNKNKVINQSYFSFPSLNFIIYKIEIIGNSLVVQWLGLHASTEGGMASIPGRGTKIPQAAGCGQKIKKLK